MELIGTKYQMYLEDELLIFRLINIKNENSFILIDKDGNKINMNKEELSKCIKLEGDVIMNIMNTTSSEGTKDTYVCIHKIEDMKNGNTTPHMIIRQDTYSSTKNSFALGGPIYVGDCITVNNCNDQKQLLEIFDYETIDNKYSCILYVDDKFDDVLQCIPNKYMKKFDQQLLGIYNSFKETNPNNFDMINGYCTSLKELLESNSFMFYYRNIFNILQIDFPIDLGNNISKDNVVELNKKQINRIEDILQSYIVNVVCVKYDKDIDISKLVDHSHIMVSDDKQDIYLINYTISAPYPTDNDIAKAMGL